MGRHGDEAREPEVGRHGSEARELEVGRHGVRLGNQRWEGMG